MSGINPWNMNMNGHENYNDEQHEMKPIKDSVVASNDAHQTSMSSTYQRKAQEQGNLWFIYGRSEYMEYGR